MQRLSKLIRQTTLFIYACVALTFFCGCPYSSVFKIDNEAQELVQEEILGKWTAMAGSEQGKMKRVIQTTITKNTDREYGILFTGFLEELNKINIATKDTIRATAFTSTINDRKFLNINIRGLYYIAECHYSNDLLSILPLNEHFTNKIIKNNDELRRLVMLHFKTRLYPYYDETFCLRNMIRAN